MNSPTPERRVLEHLWLERVNDAKFQLHFARNSLDQVVNDLPMTTPDGHFAYQKALKAECLALREYGRVLRVFHDLTVNGIIPNEDEWQKRRAAGAGENE